MLTTIILLSIALVFAVGGTTAMFIIAKNALKENAQLREDKAELLATLSTVQAGMGNFIEHIMQCDDSEEEKAE